MYVSGAAGTVSRPRTRLPRVVAGGVVYVGTADGTVSAFDASGCINSPPCPRLWSANVGAPVSGGMAVANGKLYVGSETGLVAYRLPPA